MTDTRRDVLRSGIGTLAAGGLASNAGGLRGVGETADSERESEPAALEDAVELLAESQVKNGHACSHAKFDDRTPLDAGETVDNAPTVDETHVIWEVDHAGVDRGYVAFDAEEHFHEGPFVFYTFAGAVRPLVGTTVVQAPLSDEDCEYLDEYAVVNPDDGSILLGVGARSVPFYTDVDGTVRAAGVDAALADWQVGLLGTDLVRDVIETFWTNGGDTATAVETDGGGSSSVPASRAVETGGLGVAQESELS